MAESVEATAAGACCVYLPQSDSRGFSRLRMYGTWMAAMALMIQRRHVFYVAGYDPQGAEGYYDLFRRSWKRFLKIWPLHAKLGGLSIDGEFFAHWDIEAAAPNWRVTTVYEFLRQEQIIRANMAQPMPRQILRALRWTIDYLVSGTLFRIFRAAWRFGLVLVYFQGLLLLWLALSGLGGLFAAWALAYPLGAPFVLAAAGGIAAAPVCFQLLRSLADRWFVIQINNHWPHLCEFARGEPNCFDPAINACAERLIAVARAAEADEILIVGHSGGGAIAPAIVARALAADPDVGRHGPRLVLLTLGSVMPALTLHPKATRARAIIERISAEQSLEWIDAQARKDVMNFKNFDPIASISVAAGARGRNPLIWPVRMRDMLAPEFYRRQRWNFFRMHYQFVMANDMRAPYDYFMLICGPLAVEQWARHGRELLAAFAPDGSYAETDATALMAR